MTTIWAYPSLEHLAAGAVIRDRRGVTALHLAKNQWLAVLHDGTHPVLTTVPTLMLALPVTLHPATKEVSP